MAGLRITDGVVLSGEHLAAAREAVRVYRMARIRNGDPEPRAIAELAAILAPTRPHRDTPTPATGQADVVTTRQAAELLGVSPRQVRRLAPGLGGHTIAGRLLLDAAAVSEHLEGRKIA